MKRLWKSGFLFSLVLLSVSSFAFFSGLIARPAVFEIVPAAHASGVPQAATDAVLGDYGTSSVGTVLLEAHQLVNEYGSRPYWALESFRKGDSVPNGEAPDVVAHLIACESQGVSVKHLDSNDAFSYGVGQIQSSTWSDFMAKSKLSGYPMNPNDAVPMMLWAVQNGYVSKWSCAKILGIVK